MRKRHSTAAMKSLRLLFCGLLLCTVVAGQAFAADPALKELKFTLVPQRSFLKLPAGDGLGACSAVAFNSKGELFLFHRGPRPIQCFDAEGKFLRGWGDDLIKTAHGLRIDRDDNIWVTDVGTSQVIKFDSKGNVLLVLGTGTAGIGKDQFNEPTDVAFGPKDEVYISDGYGNSRVMKFNQEGKFLDTWGSPGTDKGQFRLPHCIIVDSTGRVLVGDRENSRIQIFDDNGKWLATWKGFTPYGLAFDKEGWLFVADGRANQLLVLDDKGKVRKRFGRAGDGLGEVLMPHMLACDGEGDLYVAEVDGRRLQKFVRKVTRKP